MWHVIKLHPHRLQSANANSAGQQQNAFQVMAAVMRSCPRVANTQPGGRRWPGRRRRAVWSKKLPSALRLRFEAQAARSTSSQQQQRSVEVGRDAVFCTPRPSAATRASPKRSNSRLLTPRRHVARRRRCVVTWSVSLAGVAPSKIILMFSTCVVKTQSLPGRASSARRGFAPLRAPHALPARPVVELMLRQPHRGVQFSTAERLRAWSLAGRCSAGEETSSLRQGGGDARDVGAWRRGACARWVKVKHRSVCTSDVLRWSTHCAVNGLRRRTAPRPS